MSKFTFCFLTSLAIATLAPAAELTPTAVPLANTTLTLHAPAVVHTQPDAASPALAVCKPGATLTLDAAAVADTPAGWIAVIQPGPFTGYVANADIDKELNVIPGAKIRFKPSADSGVLAVMNRGDQATISGLHGRWTQINLAKDLTGFIPAPDIPAPPSAGPVPVAPPSPSAPVNLSTPAAITSGAGGEITRIFTGTFASSKDFFHPKPPYAWQLNDNAGVRIAYLDTSRLLLTDQIQSFAGRQVTVTGTPASMPDGKNIVLRVESLRLP